MSRIMEFTAIEGRVVIARGWREGAWGVAVNGYRVSLKVMDSNDSGIIL